MAYQLGLPILILREKGVIEEGILEKGVVGLYMPEFDVEKPLDRYFNSTEWTAMLGKWEWKCALRRRAQRQSAAIVLRLLGKIMFNTGALTFREFMMNEPLPLATIHEAVLEFLPRALDVVLFGAQAVNVYADETRMSEDVDVQSTRAHELAEELRTYLADRFHTRFVSAKSPRA